MPKVKIDPFSNGTEAMLWEARNCGRCVKGSFLKEDEKTGELRYTNADSHKLPRCRIQRDIMLRRRRDGRGVPQLRDERHPMPPTTHLPPQTKQEKPR